MHARYPKNFVLEERLERYGQAIELVPEAYAGRWCEACTRFGEPGFRELRVDVGCGKGTFLSASAAAEPDVLFVGIDCEPLCVAYAAKQVVEAGLKNAVVVPATGERIGTIFDGEIALLHINFPTPFPRKREANKRLVLVDRLLEYRRTLAPNGHILFKTDSQPLFAFAKTQFSLAGYEWQEVEPPDNLPVSEYESRLVADGARVLCIEATLGPKPDLVEQSAELSLVSYLPENLDELDYVPLGMTGTVTNLRNRKANLGW